jgi:hypothetical protein
VNPNHVRALAGQVIVCVQFDELAPAQVARAPFCPARVVGPAKAVPAMVAAAYGRGGWPAGAFESIERAAILCA